MRIPILALGVALLLGALAPEALAEAAEGARDEAAGFGNSRGVALLFWFFALATVGGALFVITRRNLISAVVGMVGTFFALAGLYAMLSAHFLAVIQILVYAGAIMVLFVFVVMILNRDEDEPWAIQGLLGKGLGGLAMLYLLVRIGSVLWQVKDEHAPPELEPLASLRVGGEAYEWGWTQALGKVLFTDFLFPFEAVSVVLLVAVVGAIAVARPGEKGDPK